MSMTQKLIEDNMNLVYYLVNTYYPTYRHDEDLIQCGMVGLCKAANTWDSNKSEFSTYASRCILNEINFEFRNRKKHSNNLSLDYEVEGKGGEPVSFGELLVGDEDVNYLDYDSIDAFYDALTEMEKEIFALRREGLNATEIAEQLGYAQSTVSSKLRQFTNKWGKFNGN